MAMISKILLLFVFAAFAESPPLPDEYNEIVASIKKDDVALFQSLIEKYPQFKVGPCGNGDIDQVAADDEAIRVLKYIGTHLAKTDRDCAFNSAVRSGKMKSIQYFVESFKIDFQPSDDFLWTVASSCDNKLAKYLFKHFKTSPTDQALESGLQSSVFSGCSSMVDFFRAKGAQLKNPIYFLERIANGDNRSYESKMDHDLSFTLAMNPKIKLNSKRVVLQPRGVSVGVDIKMSANYERELRKCPIPLLGHPRLTKRVSSYDFNKFACDVIVEPEKTSWTLHIYATQISYQDLQLKTIQEAKERHGIDLASFGKSRWLGEWKENGIRYVAGFSCKEKGADSCLQQAEARRVLSELVLVKSISN